MAVFFRKCPVTFIDCIRIDIKDFISIPMYKNVFWITILSFAGYFLIDELYFHEIRRALNDVINQAGVSQLITYTLVGIPIFAGTYLLHRKTGFFESLGLKRSILTGLFFALVCTVPMFFLYMIFYDFNTEITLNKILIIGLAAGFFEELYYRGFLYGFLYRYTRVGFILAALVAALLVAILLIFTGSDAGEIILIFLITFFSCLIYGWVYTEWDHNLWVPVFLHIFINISWEMFAIEKHEMGGSYATLIRLATVILMVGLTIISKRRKGSPLDIRRGKWFMKKKENVPATDPA